jgi:cardiolipin synthase
MTMAYLAPEDTLVDELYRASDRGIRVRLMLPGRSDIPLVRLAARSFYEKLLSCGVQIYERQGVILHAKTMVIDGQTTVIGSTNLDYRSIEYNCESSAISLALPTTNLPEVGIRHRGG